MAHTIKLKYGHPTAGWSYIDLTDSTHGILDYTPATAAEGAEDVVESGIFRIAGASVATWTAALEAIDDVFHRAAEYEREQTGAWQVRVTFQGSGEANTWEAALYEGRVEMPSGILGADWANLDLEATITWRRAANWERMVTITGTNDNVTAGVSRIFNNNDGTGTAPNKNLGHMLIAADQVPGSQPAPLGIRLAIETGTVDKIYVIHNAKSSPATMVGSFYEGETGTGDTTDATRHGGKYKNVTVPADTVGTTKSWGFDANTILTGVWLRAMLSCKFSGTVKFTPYLMLDTVKYYGASSIATGNGTDWQFLDLGMIKKPDFVTMIEEAPTWASSYVGVRMICAAGTTVSVDYALFEPTDNMAIIKIDQPGGTPVHYINFHDGTVYTVQESSAGHPQYLTGIGTIIGDIALEPNLAQSLTFKMVYGDSSVDTMTNKALVNFYAWLRRRSL